MADWSSGSLHHQFTPISHTMNTDKPVYLTIFEDFSKTLLKYYFSPISSSRIPQLFARNFDLSAELCELPDLAQKIWLSMALETFSIFWVLNFYFWAWNFHFWVQKFHFLSTGFWAVCSEHHCSFWVQNLHFLSSEFWVVYLEQFLSANFDILECRFYIFEQRYFDILAWNFHFRSAEFPF